ncbi:hypothetical protein D3C71_1562610 [compost metagenome]
MRQRHAQVRVHEADGAVQLEERQQEHRGRRHAVGQQPEEHVLVAQERIARERVGRRQRHGERDHRVDRHVDQAVDVARVPRLVGEDARVVGPGELLREEREARQDLLVRLEAHVDHPVDGQQREQDVQQQEDAALVESLFVHCSFSTSCVPTRCIQL